jgi:hypothetical protein
MKLFRRVELYVVMLCVALLAACSVMPSAPEQQIRDGANAVTATATVATSLLRLEKITVTQAKSYRAMLGTASGHLDAANATLLECRKKTASTSATNPDPCRPTVDSDIALAVTVAGEVAKVLEAKK